jgi:hypothetical protein
MSISTGFRVALGGTAVVCCPHDQVKRSLTEMLFDPAKTKIHLCACCENVFLERTDTPMFCPHCRTASMYALGGPLPEPKGAIG